MQGLMASIDEKLAELQEWRKRLLEQIQAQRQELERLDFAISVLRSKEAVTPTMHLGTTPEGRIRDLAGAIKRTLAQQGVIMTSGDIRSVLYDPSLAMTPEQLRRRLSVKTSAMNKHPTHPELADSGYKNENREIYWALPEWMMPNGKVDPARVPSILR